MPVVLGTSLAILAALWGKGLIPAYWICWGFSLVSGSFLEGCYAGRREQFQKSGLLIDARQQRIAELCSEVRDLNFKIAGLKKEASERSLL